MAPPAGAPGFGGPPGSGPPPPGPGGFPPPDVNPDDLPKMFVGGLSLNTTSEMLGRYFERYGPILDCVAVMDNGRPKGFGFVTFADPNSAR